MANVNISGVVIAFNEEDKIARCIRSLNRVCDEVVILDSFSTDKTRDIAISLGAKVFTHAFDGYIQQKNRAITYASHPYILSLDADEELSDALVSNILETKKNWDADGYIVNRLNNYGGQWIRHGVWYPDKKLRLFDSRLGAWGGENPHDKYEMKKEARLRRIQGDLLHYTMNGYPELIKQTEKFAKIAARAMYEKGRRTNLFLIGVKTLFRFIREYFVLAGFLDGKAGWQIARMNAWYVWLKYTGLLAMNRSGGELKQGRP